ncbi:ATP-binding protein [Sphaerisporangium siamense]|uniref:Anti-sigma regulatory factor (Ser/Thr protein kinase) n=1 Tax=Sphaerisporangium siamense TaxID=795645 RepID=A0A7W7GBH2_9ACTN|nr:ATP-binding protein [Sphaerisporangium siamense]MBB4705068.1 anti-sigma regulatory factor (Ser/Thr protein kinase) [Sphaerisporangium siamense]GII83874.1 ATP-binding protein [Sphaerisporangium siamense]
MIGTPDGPQTVCWDIPMDPAILADVRGRLRRTLTEWHLGGSRDLADDIVLAASEVLSNAVLYGLPPIKLTVRVSDDMLCAEVTDHGRGRPERKTPMIDHAGVPDGDDDTEHGRGLAIVEALSDEWGVQPAGDGAAKTVWFRKKCPFPAKPGDH